MMRLTSDLYASSIEQDHAYPADEAQRLLSESLNSGSPVDGFDDLRRELMSNRQEDALAAVESGDWLLVKDEAYYFDWGRFDKAAQEQKSAQRVKEISSKPLPEEKVEKLVVRILDSITGEPLASRKARFVTGQESSVRKTDGLGVAYLSPAPPDHLLAALQLHLVE
jgi:hypothetical protein